MLLGSLQSPASAYVSHGVLGDKLYTLTMMSPDALLLTVTDLKTKVGSVVPASVHHHQSRPFSLSLSPPPCSDPQRVSFLKLFVC